MPKKKTQKQREFDLVVKFNGDKKEFTRKLKLTDIETIRNNRDKIDWYTLANRKLTNEIIEEFWDDLKKYLEIDEVYNMKIDILKAARDVIKWSRFMYDVNPLRFTLDFYKEFEEELKKDCNFGYWHKVLLIPEETLDYIILEKKDKTFIDNISTKDNISLKLIEKYKDHLNWERLSQFSRELCKSKNFEKYKDRISIHDFANLKHNGIRDLNFLNSKLEMVLNEEFLLKYKDILNWENVINWHTYYTYKAIQKHQPTLVSNDFFKKYESELPEDAIFEIKQFADIESKMNGFLNYVDEIRDIDEKYIWSF